METPGEWLCQELESGAKALSQVMWYVLQFASGCRITDKKHYIAALIMLFNGTDKHFEIKIVMLYNRVREHDETALQNTIIR